MCAHHTHTCVACYTFVCFLVSGSCDGAKAGAAAVRLGTEPHLHLHSAGELLWLLHFHCVTACTLSVAADCWYCIIVHVWYTTRHAACRVWIVADMQCALCTCVRVCVRNMCVCVCACMCSFVHEQMLMQFHDNFDYASVFDLIRGVIDNEDVSDSRC